MDARIGTLTKEDGSTTYYAFVNGYHKPHFEGTLEEVEAELGLRPKVVKPEVKTKRPRAKRAKTLHEYEVTVTPKIVVYSGTHREGEYTTTVTAYNAKEANKIAKKERDEIEGTGRYAISATYKARKIN